MTAFCLVTGKLFRAPEARTSKAGKPFATARLKEGEGEAAVWWELVAFGDETTAELLKLQAGDGVAANGALRIEMFTGRDGQPRVTRKLILDGLLSTRKARRPQQRGSASAAPREPDDADPRYMRG